MPVYDDPERGRRLDADALEAWTAAVVEAMGTPADIAADVATILGASDRRAIFEAAIHPHVERIRVRMELEQHEAIKQAVRAGFGLGCLSRLSVAGELERGELVALKSPLQLTRSFSLVWHPERYRSPLWQAFKVFLHEAGLSVNTRE